MDQFNGYYIIYFGPSHQRAIFIAIGQNSNVHVIHCTPEILYKSEEIKAIYEVQVWRIHIIHTYIHTYIHL